MNNNIFFDNNNKFNPDIDIKLKKKENERKINYKLENIIYKPIIKGKIETDNPININEKIFKKKEERDLLDAEITQNRYKHKNNLPFTNYNHIKNILPPKCNKLKTTSNSSNKILNDLKKLGIIK